MKRGEVIDFHAVWRERCLPLIESGHAVIYGSPEHLARIAQRQAAGETPAAANDPEPKPPAVVGVDRPDPWADLPFGQFTGGKG